MTENPEDNKAAKPETETADVVDDTASTPLTVASGSPSQSAQRLKMICGKVFYRICRWFGEVTAICLGLAFIWFYCMNAFFAQKTADVSFFKTNVSTWFSKVFDGREADIDKIQLAWNPQANVITLDVTNINVKSKNQETLQHIDRLTTAFSFNSVIWGRPKAQSVKISGGAVTWRRGKDGAVVAGLGTPGAVGKFGALDMGSPDKSGSDKSDIAPRQFGIGGLDSVDVENAMVFIRDGVTGLNLTFEKTDFHAEKTGPNYTIGLDAFLKEDSPSGHVSGRALISPDFEDFDLKLSVDQINPSQVGLSGEAVVAANHFDAPVTASFHMVSTQDAGLTVATLDLAAGAGKIKLGDRVEPLTALEVKTSFDPEMQTLNVSSLAFDTEKYSGAGQAQFKNIGRPAAGFFKQPFEFDAALRDVRVDLSHKFDDPFDVSSFTLSGTASVPDRKVNIATAKMDMGEFALITDLETKLGDSGAPIFIKSKGRVEGKFTPQDLLGLWPSHFALGARNWIKRAILKADITNLTYDLHIPEGRRSGEALQNENLALIFDISEAEVRYISTMTTANGVSGKSILRGNSFIFEGDKGRVGGLVAESAKVTIPRLSPKGGDLNIDIMGAGQVSEMLALINQEPFKFADRFDIIPGGFKGHGRTRLQITRPLLVDFDPGLIRYDVSGDFTDVSVPFKIGSHHLENGRFSFSSDRTGMRVMGPFMLGPWQADLNWFQPFGDNAPGNIYQVTGKLDRSTLDAFGIGLRKNFDGIIGLKIDAKGRGLSIAEAAFTADLMDADLRIGDQWQKAKGIAGTASGRAAQNAVQGLSIEDVRIETQGMSVSGYAAFARDLRLLQLRVSEGKIEGVSDAKINIKPNHDNSAFDVNVSGDYLDISQIVTNMMANRRKGESKSAEPGLPFNLTAELNRLILGRNYVVKEARLAIENDGFGTRAANITGTGRAGAFTAQVTPLNDGKRKATIEIPNASTAVQALMRSQSLKGGRMKVEAVLPKTGEAGAMSGNVNVENVVIVNAPVFAQMLSLASLKGLSDALGGEGLQFEYVDMPFSFDRGLLSFRDARAVGPALGLTGSGDVHFIEKLIDINGVLVPAYTANSALASIPLIGDIFVGKKGEGIFALSYSVKGPYSATQVAVNPLSALTPGFLRRIFDKQRKDLPEVDMSEPGMPSEAEAETEASQAPPKPDE